MKPIILAARARLQDHEPATKLDFALHDVAQGNAEPDVLIERLVRAGVERRIAAKYVTGDAK